MSSYKYVGPSKIRDESAGSPEGAVIRSSEDLSQWLRGHPDDEGGWDTYVVNTDGELVLAPRRSEHVACAGGRDVLAAGEIRFDQTGTVVEVTNQSTGYCPPEDSWHDVAAALDRAGIEHPARFTYVARFRRCPGCGERNLVKDEWYVCAFCEEELPTTWNLGDHDSDRE